MPYDMGLGWACDAGCCDEGQGVLGVGVPPSRDMSSAKRSLITASVGTLVAIARGVVLVTYSARRFSRRPERTHARAQGRVAPRGPLVAQQPPHPAGQDGRQRPLVLVRDRVAELQGVRTDVLVGDDREGSG